jgi:hypothetical protein
MGFLELNLFRHPSGAELDPGAVIRKAQRWFPQALLIPGDQLALRAENAEALWAKELQADPNGRGRIVVDTLWRNAREYGPAYAFRIPLEGAEPVQGVARRYDVIFLFDDPLPTELYNRLLEFLKTFGVGKISRSVEDKRQSEVLYDLAGQPHESGLAPEIRWPTGVSP